MKHNTFLVKPASSLCNLRCRYCFYDDVSNSRACKNMGLLSHEMAGELVEKAFAATEEGGKPVAKIQVKPCKEQHGFAADVNGLGEKEALYFSYKGTGAFNFMSFDLK